MYFWIAIISMFSWVMHSSLFAKYARKLDWISTSFYRSLSLLITMLPILFLADFSSAWAIVDNIWLYFIWWLLWWIAVIFFFEAQKYLPIWIVVALDKLIVLVVIIMSYFAYWEILNTYAAFWVAAILISIIFLVLVKNKMPHLDNNIFKWVSLMIPRIIWAWIWFFVLWILSKKVDFAFSAYLMEAFVFVWILISIFVKYLFNKTHIMKISLRDYSKLFLFSLFTLWWTWWYALAVSMWWPQWVIASVLATDIIFVSILWYFFHKEKLTLRQWMFILTTFIWLVLLKLSV